jgi:hypothetical protein
VAIVLVGGPSERYGHVRWLCQPCVRVPDTNKELDPSRSSEFGIHSRKETSLAGTGVLPMRYRKHWAGGGAKSLAPPNHTP